MKTALAFCGLLLSGCLAAAQQPASTNGNEVTASNLTVRGCLQGARQGHFTLLQASTGAVFDVQGNASDLKHSRGKLVEAKGNELAPAARGGMQSLPLLKVNQLRVVADKCPVQGTGKSARTGNGTGEAAPASAETPRYQRPDAPETPPNAGTNPNEAGATGTPSAGTGNPPK